MFFYDAIKNRFKEEFKQYQKSKKDTWWDLFKNRLNDEINKKRETKNAYKKLDEGNKIVVNPRSDRYGYETGADFEYDKQWRPVTEQEKETLSPENFYRQGERKNQKDKIYSKIFQSAVNHFKKDGISEDQLERKATNEANEIFENQYREKQISIPSTALQNVEYDPQNKVLQVQFTSGRTKYNYPNVPVEKMQGLLKAHSKGEYFMANIHDQYTMNPGHKPSSSKQKAEYKTHIKNIKKLAKEHKDEEEAMKNN